MSGGHFGYNQFHFDNIASDIEAVIINNDSTEKDDYGQDIGQHYPKAVIAKFKQAVKVIRKAGKMAHDIDYLLSVDYGEDTFLKMFGRE